MVAHRNSELSSVVSSAFVVFLLAHQTQQAPTLECGRSTFTSRIVGGSEVMANEFPWMAHLLIRRSNGQLFHCGGTLISATHVLTTTRCVVHNQTKIYDLLKITLGTNDPSTVGESSGQVFDWKKIVIPAGVELMEDDIAIVTLSKPVTFTDYVQPACLPFADDTDPVNEYVVLTGWGEYNSSASVLRKIQTTVLSGDQCQITARKVPALSANNAICTEQGFSQHRNSDDGGTMNYYNAKLDRWFVLGVAGRGDSSDCYSSNKTINVFTRVGSRLDFIRDYSGVVPPITNSSTKKPEEFTTISYQETTKNGTNFETMMETTTTVTTTNQPIPEPIPFTCQGKTDGNYPNPASSCSANFYICSHGYAHLFACANGSIYDTTNGRCNWPFNVTGC